MTRRTDTLIAIAFVLLLIGTGIMSFAPYPWNLPGMAMLLASIVFSLIHIGQRLS